MRDKYLLTHSEYKRYIELSKKIPHIYEPIPPEKVIEELIEWIITSLYKLDEKNVHIADDEKLEKLGLNNEPINWGDLSCHYVERIGDENNYIAYIQEANSKILEEFIEGWLRKWGWNVRVITDW